MASDLIAQAEHDVYAQSILITNNLNLIKKVNKSLIDQLKKLPKKNIASKSLKNFGLAIYAKNTSNIIKIVNQIAPEHLELCVQNLKKYTSKITNAGSIFLGKFSPEAMEII